jgi:hypothetical protein
MRITFLLLGEEVLGVYPDTTSFYPAVVSQAPRRSSMNAEPSVTVQFHGDADETGFFSMVEARGTVI